MIEVVAFKVEFRNVGGEAAAIGSAGPYTLVVDRPADAGGRGLGFNGGQLLYLAIGGCVSNDLFREATTRGIELTTVRVVVRGDFRGDPAISDLPIDDPGGTIVPDALLPVSVSETACSVAAGRLLEFGEFGVEQSAGIGLEIG